jgi:hypothetical protein
MAEAWGLVHRNRDGGGRRSLPWVTNGLSGAGAGAASPQLADIA